MHLYLCLYLYVLQVGLHFGTFNLLDPVSLINTFIQKTRLVYASWNCNRSALSREMKWGDWAFPLMWITWMTLKDMNGDDFCLYIFSHLNYAFNLLENVLLLSFIFL